VVQFGLAEGEGVAMVIIRRAVGDDCEGILRAHVASIRELCARDYTPEQIEAWAGPKRADVYLKVMERHTLVVAEEDGEILGFGEVAVHPEGGLGPGEVEICGLYVHPAHGRCGVGRAIVDHVDDQLADHAVVVGRDAIAGVDVRVERTPGPPGRRQCRSRPGRARSCGRGPRR
jgi:ribosomal protein S18 acetylase RimI-like enzyme